PTLPSEKENWKKWGHYHHSNYDDRKFLSVYRETLLFTLNDPFTTWKQFLFFLAFADPKGQMLI
ncbi:unnamed protein product, partial [Onchocerca flexuosa]|uniref:Cytochrome P450 n=1 Tax=Onchocerca flexuosa TaxID=387005 RepID=A0A183H4V2_9BILA